jgi:aryl-alcohol dehydrogenase-like predicted oxidoreductase
MKRTDIIISSKCFWDVGPGPNDCGLSRKHIMESVNNSLRKIGTDYIDIFYAHRYEARVIDQIDPNLEEVLRAMDDLIHQGKVLYWGSSCWTGAQIAHAYGLSNQWNLYKHSVEQPQYNMFYRKEVEADLIPVAKGLGCGLITWSPLLNGILTGKYNDGIPSGSRLANPKVQWLEFQREITTERIEKIRRLSQLAQELGGTTAQLAIAWLLRIPEVSSVIIGGTNIYQVKDNLKSIALLSKLTPEVLSRIDKILGNDPCPQPFAPEKPSFDV